MTETNPWLVGLCVGGVASIVYFWGLWITAARLKDARHPLGMYATSLALRLTVLGAALVCVLDGDWRRVVAATIAFVTVRFVAVYTVVGYSVLPTN